MEGRREWEREEYGFLYFLRRSVSQAYDISLLSREIDEKNLDEQVTPRLKICQEKGELGINTFNT